MIRQRIYELLENDPKSNDKLSIFVNWTLMTVICLSVIAVVLSSVDELYIKYKKIFNYVEYFSIIVFTIEYFIRLWIAPIKYKQQGKPFFLPYLCYIFSFMGLIDLFAILPFYLPLFINADLRILRIVRMFRLFRILKLVRYNNSLELIVTVLKKQKEKIYITIFFIIIIILLTSSVMYFIENKVQPEKFPNIPATLWWAVATLTTVGYGDIYPITILGKILGGVISILGIGLIAMPSGIISMGLIDEMKERKERKKKERRNKHVNIWSNNQIKNVGRH